LALGNLRRYDVQAKYAFVLVIASLGPGLVALWSTWKRFDFELGRIKYSSQSWFVPGFFSCLLLSMILAALGFTLGWNSAGQRRNDRSGRSWIAFFVGGGVLTFDIVLLIAFFMLRLRPAG